MDRWILHYFYFDKNYVSDNIIHHFILKKINVGSSDRPEDFSWCVFTNKQSKLKPVGLLQYCEMPTYVLNHHYTVYVQVCELDIIFNFEKAYYMLDELLIAGEIQETSKKNVLKAIAAQDMLQEVRSHIHPCYIYLNYHLSQSHLLFYGVNVYGGNCPSFFSHTFHAFNSGQQPGQIPENGDSSFAEQCHFSQLDMNGGCNRDNGPRCLQYNRCGES